MSDQLKARYEALKIRASIKPFFANIPGLLAKSDLAQPVWRIFNR